MIVLFTVSVEGTETSPEAVDGGSELDDVLVEGDLGPSEDDGNNAEEVCGGGGMTRTKASEIGRI